MNDEILMAIKCPICDSMDVESENGVNTSSVMSFDDDLYFEHCQYFCNECGVLFAISSH